MHLYTRAYRWTGFRVPRSADRKFRRVFRKPQHTERIPREHACRTRQRIIDVILLDRVFLLQTIYWCTIEVFSYIFKFLSFSMFFIFLRIFQSFVFYYKYCNISINLLMKIMSFYSEHCLIGFKNLSKSVKIIGCRTLAYEYKNSIRCEYIIRYARLKLTFHLSYLIRLHNIGVT